MILHEDTHLLVVHKVAGLTTEGTVGSLEDQMQQGRRFVRAAHRLDKAASGIVIFAKSSKALARLHKAFRERLLTKSYVAWIEGDLEEQEGVLDDFLVKEEHRARIADCKEIGAKRAILRYRRLQKGLLHIDLDTGRYHQIRVQLASRGHPIWNDHKYGAKQQSDMLGIGLHHYRIALMHPVTKEPYVFTHQPSFIGDKNET